MKKYLSNFDENTLAIEWEFESGGRLWETFSTKEDFDDALSNYVKIEDTELKYQQSSFFNQEDTYVFVGFSGEFFESKVHFEKGHWWTNESCQYKATTLKCKLV